MKFGSLLSKTYMTQSALKKFIEEKDAKGIFRNIAKGLKQSKLIYIYI